MSKIVIILLAWALVGCRVQNEESIIQFYRFDELDQTGVIVQVIAQDTSYYLFRSHYFDKNLPIKCEYLVAQKDTNYVLNGPFYCLYKSGDTLSKGLYKNGNPLGQRTTFWKNGNIEYIEFFRKDKFGFDQNFDSLGNKLFYCTWYKDSCFYYIQYDSLGRRSNFKGPPLMTSHPKTIGPNKVQGGIFLAQEPTVRRRLNGFFLPEMRLQDSLILCNLEKVDSMKYYYEIKTSKAGSYNALISMEELDLIKNKTYTDTISFEVNIE